MSFTADLNPGHSIEENRAQHLAEFTAYMAPATVERLRDMEQTILDSLTWTSSIEDEKTQRAKLAAVRGRLATLTQSDDPAVIDARTS